MASKLRADLLLVEQLLLENLLKKEGLKAEVQQQLKEDFMFLKH